jgi:hypothetical protein
MAIGYAVLTGCYYSGVFSGRDLRFMSTALFGQDGDSYDQTAILTSDNKLNSTALAEVGLPRYTTTFAISQLCYNLSLGATIVHILLYNWPELKRGTQCPNHRFNGTLTLWSAFGGFDFLKSIHNIDDPHYNGPYDSTRSAISHSSNATVMKKYREVPQWWYCTVFLISLGIGIGCSVRDLMLLHS